MNPGLRTQTCALAFLQMQQRSCGSQFIILLKIVKKSVFVKSAESVRGTSGVVLIWALIQEIVELGFPELSLLLHNYLT